MKTVVQSLLLLVWAYSALAIASVDSTIEKYGMLPKMRSLSISPDGKHYAYIMRGEEHDHFVVARFDGSIVTHAKATKFKARSTYFATNKHVLFLGSDHTFRIGYRSAWEHSGALVYNLKTEKVRLLFNRTEGIHPAQTGLGRISAINADSEVAYMPAFSDISKPAYNLYRVNLNTGKARVHARGNSRVVDWFVTNDGTVLAREEYDEKKKVHSLWSKVSGEWQQIYSKNTDVPVISIRAVAEDNNALLFVDALDDKDAIYSINLADGFISGPLFSNEEADVEDLHLDINRRLLAVGYSGFIPTYEFSSHELAPIFDRLQATFIDSSIFFESATEDNRYIIVRVSGGDAAGMYYLLDSQKIALTRLAAQYDVDEIGKMKPIRYKARDGLMIPAVLTMPPGIEKPSNLPLIALPHGGPESYDRMEFDWMAQYFASKGYLVLQPNFRGSAGFGYEFMYAGRGRWGREMQDDVSDGIATLVEAGYADPDKVCIVGSSYGGYSALAGGAFSPELYRCVVSINGVSDLPMMLSDKKRDYGFDHWVISYWHRVIGDSKSEIDKLNSISPVNFAQAFEAPVLLIHGKDDTVVPIDQSKQMYKALRKADKDVELIQLKGEDHWLSTSATRLQLLQAVDQFLDTHNPVNPP